MGRVFAAAEAALFHGGEDLFDFEVEGVGAVDNEIGEVDEGPDEGDAAGADGGVVLAADGLGVATALDHIALQAALVAEVVLGIDVDFEVVEEVRFV